MEPFPSLADYTSPRLIVPQLLQRDVAGVILELSRVLYREGRVPDATAFSQAVLNRELLTSTAMEEGMAFPHARLKGLKELSFALGRSTEPVLWGESGLRQVRLVFLLAVPADDTAHYLPLISGLARLGQDTELLKQISAADSASGLFACLGRIPLRHLRKQSPVTRPPSG